MMTWRHAICVSVVIMLSAAQGSFASTKFQAEVQAVSATHENGGVSLAWRVYGGSEFDPKWRVEARPAGMKTEPVWQADGLEIEFGREPNIVVYSAWIAAPETVANLNVRLWADGFQKCPDEWLEVAVMPGIQPCAPSLRLAALSAPVQGERIRIVIKDSALYQVTAPEIASALKDATEADVRGWIAATNLSITCMGEQVPWHAVGTNDGIAFIGKAYGDVYTERNVYWIERGAGLAMLESGVSVPQEPHVQGSFWNVERFEKNLFPRELIPAERSLDYWYWESLDTAVSLNKNPVFLPFATPDAEEGGDAAFSVWWKLNLMSPATNLPLALVTLSLKDQTVLELALDRNAPDMYEFEVPQALLTDANELKLSIKRTNGALRAVYVIDSLTVGYRRKMAARGDMLMVALDEPGQEVVAGGFSSAEISAYSLLVNGQPERLVGAMAGQATNGLWQCAFVAPPGVSNILIASAGRTPEVVEGVAANPWAGTEHEIDYMVVSPEAFLPTLQPLLALRESQGLRVGVITTEDLYRHCNHGRFSPYALREFIQHSRAWSVPPSMLLIVGWGHYDYFASYDQSWQPNHVAPGIMEIPYPKAVSGKMLVGSDNILADLNGDKVPELAVGRLPAHDAAELTRIVNKTLTYEATRNARTNIVAVADLADGDWNFKTYAQNWNSLLPRGVEKLLISEPSTGDPESKRKHIRDAWHLRLNSGTWLTGYFGHANTGAIGGGSTPYLLSSDVVLLENEGRAGIMLGTTCGMNEMFQPYQTRVQSEVSYIGARLLFGSNGGMTATLAPTSISTPTPGDVVAYAFARAVGERRYLGEAVLDSLSDLREHGTSQWLIQTMLLLGDPALDFRPAFTGTLMIIR